MLQRNARRKRKKIVRKLCYSDTKKEIIIAFVRILRDKYINRLYAYKLFEKNELYVFMRNIHSSFHLTTA